MKRRSILKNKPVSLYLSILKINEIVMYEVWYYYVKQKYEKKKRNTNTSSFIAYVKTEDI